MSSTTNPRKVRCVTFVTDEWGGSRLIVKRWKLDPIGCGRCIIEHGFRDAMGEMSWREEVEWRPFVGGSAAVRLVEAAHGDAIRGFLNAEWETLP